MASKRSTLRGIVDYFTRDFDRVLMLCALVLSLGIVTLWFVDSCYSTTVINSKPAEVSHAK